MSDEPPVLPVGTAVSAKYKGAFCEAKVSRVFSQLRYRVSYKEPYTGTDTLNEEQIRKTNVPIRVGRTVLAWHHVHKTYVDAQITRIQDQSQYTVVFDDGDITTLRRNSLCLKSGRHFNESETLDQLPLTHPEHFSNPVVGGRSRRRNRNREDDSDGEHEEVDPEMEGYSSEVGRVVMGENLEKKRSKDWPPGLIMLPKNPKVLNTKEEFLIRSFKDDRFYNVPKKDVIEFDRDFGERLEKSNTPFYNGVQKAMRYLNTGELPANWEKDFFHSDRFETDPELNFSDSSDDEPCEEKDRFVAQLYKFLDEAGTPLNKTPTIGGEDVDLYRLFSVVNKLGGYNKVSNHNKWKSVMGRLKYGNGQSVTNQVKQVYKKCLLSFEAFYKTLGVTMLNHTKPSKKNKGRSLIRDKDRATPINSPRLEKDEDSQDKKEEEKQPAPQSQSSLLATEDNSREKSKRRSDDVRKRTSQENAEGGDTEATTEPSSSMSSSLSEPSTSSAASGRPKRSTEVRSWAKEKKTPKTAAGEKVKSLVEKFEDQNKKEEEKEKGQQTRSKSQLPKTVTSLATTSDNKKQQDVIVVRPTTSNVKEVVKESSVVTRDVKVSQASKPKKSGPAGEDDKLKKAVRKRSYLESEGTSENITSQTVNVGDKLKVYYGTTIDSKITYEAKVVEIDRDGSVPLYLVHYTGWNTRYDEWINPGRVAENLSATTKAKRLKHATAVVGASSSSSSKSAATSSNPSTVSMTSNASGAHGSTPASKTAAATAASIAARRKRNVSMTRRTSLNNELPRSTTPSSSTSNSSRPKTPATPATRSATRSARQEQKRTRRISVQTDTSVHTDTESAASESEPELTRTRSGGGKSDEPELRTYKKRVPRMAPNKSRVKQRGEDDDDTEKEEEAVKERPKRARKMKRGAEKMADESDDDIISLPKGRDFDLNQIRSELKGFSKGEKSLPVSTTSDSADKDTSSDDSAKLTTAKIHVTAEVEDEEENDNDDDEDFEEDVDKDVDAGPPSLDVKPEYDEDASSTASASYMSSAPKLTAVKSEDENDAAAPTQEEVVRLTQSTGTVSESIKSISTAPKSINSVDSAPKLIQSVSSAPKTVQAVNITSKTIPNVGPVLKLVQNVESSSKMTTKDDQVSKTIQGACSVSKLIPVGASKSLLLSGTSPKSATVVKPSAVATFDVDVYEFKEPEPFEFETRSSLNEDKSKTKRLPRFYEDAVADRSSRSVSGTSDDTKSKSTPTLPFRSPLATSGYDEDDEDEDVEVEEVVALEKKKLDPFDKLVESPSFNIVKTSPDKPSEPHHHSTTPPSQKASRVFVVVPPKPATPPPVPAPALTPPPPLPTTPLSPALYREPIETSDDCSRDNMELSDTESQTQPIFNTSAGCSVAAVAAATTSSSTRSDEALSDAFTKSSSEQNTMDLEFSKSQDKNGDEDEIKASIRRVIEQTSSSTDDDTRDALLQVTLPTTCYQPKRQDAANKATSILSFELKETKTEKAIVEIAEKSAFSILNKLSPPHSGDDKSSPSLLEAINRESQKLHVTDKMKINEDDNEKEEVMEDVCAKILPNLDCCFGKATKVETKKSKEEDVENVVKIDEKEVSVKEEEDEKAIATEDDKYDPLLLTTKEETSQESDAMKIIEEDDMARVRNETKNPNNPDVFGPDVVDNDNASAVVVSEPKKRRKVLSRPYVESDSDSSSDSDNLVIARSDDESQTNSAMEEKDAKETWSGANNESSSSSSMSPRPSKAREASSRVEDDADDASVAARDEERNFKFDQIAIDESVRDKSKVEEKTRGVEMGDASESAEPAIEKTRKEEDSRLHSMLLCEETIPRSPAPPAEETIEEPVRRSKSALEMPFASVPGSSNNKSILLNNADTVVKLHAQQTSVSMILTSENVNVNQREKTRAGINTTPPTSPESTVSNASPRDNNGGLSPDSRDVENTNTCDAFQQKAGACNKISSYSEDDSSQMACDRSKNNVDDLVSTTSTTAGVVVGGGGAAASRKRRRSYRGGTGAEASKRGRRLGNVINRSRQNSDSEEEEDVSDHSLVGSSNSAKATSNVPYNRGNRSERPVKYDFRPNLDGVTDKNERINLIMQKITELRKVYADLKAELSDIERRKKKMKKRQREALKTNKQVATCA